MPTSPPVFREALEEWHSAVQAATAKACEHAAKSVKGASGRVPMVVEGLRVRWLGANGGGGFCVCFFGGCYSCTVWLKFLEFFFAGFGR